MSYSTELMNSYSEPTLNRLKISVVIPVHNGGNAFYRCLDSIQASRRQPDEVIVVADGDTDGSWKLAESFGVRVLRFSSAGGPARARNYGAKAAKGDILFFIDADVTVGPDTIQRVEETFLQNSHLAALIGSYDDSPGADNFLSQYKNLFHHYTHQISSLDAFTFWGACGAIKRSVFHSIGGFDEAYRKPCIEDIELGYRLKRANYSIRLCKDIQVKHLKRWEPLSLLKAEIFYRALPWTELLLNDNRFEADLNLSYTNRLSVVLVFLLIGNLAGSFIALELLGLAIASAISLLIINRNIYQFFYQKRGLVFSLRVIPWHWFYFLYGGIAFAYGTLRHFLSRFHLPKPPLPYGVCKSN